MGRKDAPCHHWHCQPVSCDPFLDCPARICLRVPHSSGAVPLGSNSGGTGAPDAGRQHRPTSRIRRHPGHNDSRLVGDDLAVACSDGIQTGRLLRVRPHRKHRQWLEYSQRYRHLASLSTSADRDPIPISVAAPLVFGSINPNSWIVWRSPNRPSDGVFIWELVPVDATATRLISRIRWSYATGAWFKVLGVFTEFADHVAVRRILEGVRDRAEGRASRRYGSRHSR